MESEKQLAFIYRLTLYAPFSNGENETVLYRLIEYNTGDSQDREISDTQE